MVWIRIFRTRKEAEKAKKLLEKGGFIATISEDKLFGISIRKFGVPARFRLDVAKEDVEKIATYLAKKLNKR